MMRFLKSNTGALICCSPLVFVPEGFLLLPLLREDPFCPLELKLRFDEDYSFLGESPLLSVLGLPNRKEIFAFSSVGFILGDMRGSFCAESWENEDLSVDVELVMTPVSTLDSQD